ncbi:MAG: hypothetical protein ACU0CT_12705 [Paracoccaceae bacterium]|jgi:VIT1/CCC1 family predicted Fe2+/Mn2+ transporter|nr:hypothetical protein [Paracoccaceae bacterium]
MDGLLMGSGQAQPHRHTDRIKAMDEASFGIIYGAVTVLSLLISFEAHPASPIRVSVILFGSVTAILMSKVFAEVMAGAIRTGDRPTRAHIRQAWDHSRAALVAANLPAAIMLASAFGLLAVQTAVALSQGFCVALLMIFGARVGWVVDRALISAILGACCAGGLGVVLSAAKYLFH